VDSNDRSFKHLANFFSLIRLAPVTLTKSANCYFYHIKFIIELVFGVHFFVWPDLNLSYFAKSQVVLIVII